MSLLATLRKKRAERFAAAVIAVPAVIDGGGERKTAIAAKTATAIAPKPIPAPPAKVGAGDTATAWRWLIDYRDKEPEQVCILPEPTHAEVLALYPDAVAAEPFTPTIRQPSAPMTAEEERAIRAWLALIEETDPATIAEVIGQCQRDADARDYFTGRATELNPKGGE